MPGKQTRDNNSHPRGHIRVQVANGGIKGTRRLFPWTIRRRGGFWKSCSQEVAKEAKEIEMIELGKELVLGLPQREDLVVNGEEQEIPYLSERYQSTPRLGGRGVFAAFASFAR